MKNINQSDIALHLAGITSDFVMPLGVSLEEKINGLQSIKDSMAESLFQALNEDCSLSDTTVNWLQTLYMEADNQIKQLQRRSTALTAAIA